MNTEDMMKQMDVELTPHLDKMKKAIADMVAIANEMGGISEDSLTPERLHDVITICQVEAITAMADVIRAVDAAIQAGEVER